MSPIGEVHVEDRWGSMVSMGRLIYSVIGSLDGCHCDSLGNFDWAAPDEEVLAFVNEQERHIGTYLYGRRSYEMMTVWETDPAAAAQTPQSAAFAEIWQSATKVVYSTTLETVSTQRTTLERRFDATAVSRLKAESAADLTIFGPDLAAHAFRAGLVDEVRVIIAPVIIGSGQSYYPPDVRFDLELVDQQRFTSGMVSLCYRVLRPDA